MILPQREMLPHETPEWVQTGAVFFVTICGVPRGINQFCRTDVASKVFSATEFYLEQFRWWPSLLLLMPDHVHMLVSFPRAEAMKKVVSAWKHYLTRECRLNWQRDFFDHRLRAEESYQEKARYIRENPVRAGLVQKPEEWPFVWEASRR